MKYTLSIADASREKSEKVVSRSQNEKGSIRALLSIAKTASRKAKRFSFVLALPIFPASHPASIVGADELNFCVRDGNRWTLVAINTNLCRGLSATLCQRLSSVTSSGPYTLKTEHCDFRILRKLTEPALWSSFRLISISQLHASQRFHL